MVSRKLGCSLKDHFHTPVSFYLLLIYYLFTKMKIKYDKKIDALYMEFGKGDYFRSRKISNSIMVDEDKKGKVLGVEVLEASKNVKAFNPEKINCRVFASA